MKRKEKTGDGKSRHKSSKSKRASKPKLKSIGYLTSPTRTFSAEAFLRTKALEGDFVFLRCPETKRKVIGRITGIEIQNRDGDNEAYCDIELYGSLNEKGKIEMKRDPLPPNTRIYAMKPDEVAQLLGLGKGMYVGNIVQTSTQIHINPDKLLRGHTVIIGKTGSGKSWTVGVLIEELAKLKLPALVLDPHGEYLSIAQPFKSKAKDLKKWKLPPLGFKVKVLQANPAELKYGDIFFDVKPAEMDVSPSLKRYVIVPYSDTTSSYYAEQKSLDEEEFPIFVNKFRELFEREPTVTEVGNCDIRKSTRIDSVTNTPQITYIIRERTVEVEMQNVLLETGRVTIVDMHNLDPEQSRMLLDWLETNLFMLRKQKLISPFINIIEESHTFAPSIGKVYSSETMEMLSKEARKFGMPTWFISQRPQLLSTTIRANCENWIVLKVTHPSDQAAIIGACEGLDSNSADIIKNLPIGTAFLTGTIVEFPLIIQVRHRQSEHYYESGFREQLKPFEVK